MRKIEGLCSHLKEVCMVFYVSFCGMPSLQQEF